MEREKQDQIERWIEDRKFEEARQALDESLRDDPSDEIAWALAAYLGRSGIERELALRRVYSLTDNLLLHNWALNELAVLAGPNAEPVTRPPLTLIEVSKLKPVRRKASLSLVLLRLGLAAFFVGLLGIYGIPALQERGVELIEQGARNLIPLLRISVLCFFGSVALGVIGVLVVVASTIISFFPRRD